MFKKTKSKRVFKKPHTLVALEKKVNKLVKDDKAQLCQIDNSSGFTLSNTAQFVNLTQIAQGTDRNTRFGNAVQIKQMEVRFSQVAGSATPCMHRLIYFQWNSGLAGTAPIVGQILQSVTNVLSDYQPDYRKNYRVIKDLLMVSPGTGQEGTIKTKHFKSKINHPASYSGTTAATFDKGQIYLMSLGSTADAVFTCWTRVIYEP